MPRNMLVGRLTMHRDGYGFVIPEATSVDASLKARLAGDVFIPPHAIGSSMHGDRVIVEVANVRNDGRADGRIVRSLARAHPTVVGIFHYGDRHNYVKAIDEKITQEILIPPGMEKPRSAESNSSVSSVSSTTVPSVVALDLDLDRHGQQKHPQGAQRSQGKSTQENRSRDRVIGDEAE